MFKMNTNGETTSSHDRLYLSLDPDGEEITIQILDDDHLNRLADDGIEYYIAEDIDLSELEDDKEALKKILRSNFKRSCHVCGSSFKHLARHLETHGPHNCTDCLMHFEDKKEHDEHIRIVHNIDSQAYKCDICSVGFTSVSNLAVHNFKHTGIYSCPLCKFIVKGKHKHSLVNHIKRHEGQYSVFCEVCGQGFIEKHILATHMEIHEAIPKYECEFCKKKFTVKRYLEVHKSFNHKKELYGIEESFQCEICGRHFSFEKSLVRHLSAIHKVGEDRTVQCEVCKKKIANNHNLKKHMRIHTGEKRFCCDSCGKAFAEKKYLQKHQAGHEREKQRRSELQQMRERIGFKMEPQDIPDIGGSDCMAEYLFFPDEDEDNPHGGETVYLRYS